LVGFQTEPLSPGSVDKGGEDNLDSLSELEACDMVKYQDLHEIKKESK
jgi:hypothetical protein